MTYIVNIVITQTDWIALLWGRAVKEEIEKCGLRVSSLYCMDGVTVILMTESLKIGNWQCISVHCIGYVELMAQ